MAQEKKIMVVDDDEAMRAALFAALSRQGHEVEIFDNGEDALKSLGPGSRDLVISDVKMAPMDGMEFLGKLKKKVPDMPVIMITAFGTVAMAVSAMKKGASDFLLKPFSLDDLDACVQRAVTSRTLEEDAGTEGSKIVTGDPAFSGLIKVADRVAASKATVLILGESGTGKELLARRVHQKSGRDPLIAVNCAAIPDNLLESELMGFEKGAFTGAVKTRIGKFEAAGGGTILLDEVGELSPMLQAKLLRLLQEKVVERLGGDHTIPVDVRVIATTHRNLATMVQEGEFREDLYYRLNVIPLTIPPLRERPSDLMPLAEHFLDLYTEREGLQKPNLSAKAKEFIVQHDWPGNVREMENRLQRAILLCQNNEISEEDIVYGSDLIMENHDDFDPAPGATIRDMETKLIMATLESTGGNQTQAAKHLGISRRTLHNKLKILRIET